MVAVPVTAAILVVGAMAVLLEQSEKERVRERHHREIHQQTNGLIKTIYDTVRSLQEFALRHEGVSLSTYLAGVERFGKHLMKLKELVRNDPVELGLVSEAESKSQIVFAILDSIRGEADGSPSISVDKLRAFGQQRPQLEKMMADTYGCLSRIIERQEEIERESPRRQEVFTRRLKTLLVVAALGMVVLAFALEFFFDRSTLSRLQVILDNMARLKNSQPLGEPLGGTDEISKLDTFFRAMAAELAESIRKQKAAIDNAADVICSVSAEGYFTAVSPASETVWKHSPANLLNTSLLDIIAEEDRQSTRVMLEQVITNKTGTFESKVLRGDGTPVDVLWSGQWSDSEEAIFAVAHDITERKDVERMKQQFVGVVSHELRTPLTSVKGVLSLLSEGVFGTLEGKGKAMVATAEAEVTRLMKLINDLLDVARMESGRIELLVEEAPLRLLVNRSIDSVRMFAEDHDVRLVADDIPDMMIWVDGDRIIQVLINLISNAVKFSPVGSEVVVEARKDGDLIEIRVCDKGRGIPEGLRQAIFERFRQVEASDATKKGGTGLGLPISKSIVERHGGYIGVDSAIGEGSTFWIRLPIR